MNLNDIARVLELEPLTPQVKPDEGAPLTGGFVSDLLSDVLANGPKGGVLVTIQVHMNVIAVAVHAELAGVIFAADRRPEADVCQKAAEAGIALYVSKDSAFELVGRLYELGLRGRRE
jgi:hypothetical protein